MANFLKSLFVKGVEIDPAGAASDQVLKYNGTKFVPGTASTVGSIDDLSDVIITTPSNGQALVYNGTDWVNGASGVAGSTYTATIGDGTNDVFVLSHGLNTRDVFVTIRNAASPYEVIDAYWAATTTGTVTIDFSVVPTTNSVRVAIYAAVTGNNTALALDTLTDVVVTSPLEYESLVYDGTNWVNQYASNATYVRNAEATTLTTGTVVYLFGATGDHATVKRADNDSDATSAKTVGLVASPIAASENGPVVTRGYVDGIDLSTGYASGDILWLGENGAFTKVKPTAPEHLVFVGVVVRATNNGIVYVATQNGYELDELHDVSLPNPTAGQVLTYNGSLWTAASASGVSTLNDLTDVSAASPIAYQPLIWDGTNWQSGTYSQYLRLGEEGVSDWMELTPTSVTFTPMSGSNATFGVDGISFSNFVGVVNVEFDNIYFNNGTLNAKIAPLGATAGQVLAFNDATDTFEPSNIPIDSLSDVVITSPTDGQVLKYNTATSLWTNASAGGGGASITVSDTPPVSPTAGALWFESDSGLTFIYYDSQWIEIGAGASYDPITRIVQAKGDLILGTASQTVDRLTVGTNSQRLIANSSAATGVSWANDTTNTVIDAKGDLLVGATADVVAKLPVGVDNQVLVADSTATNGVAWSSQASGFRNVLINGGFDVWQRGTTAAIPSSVGTSYLADRWSAYRPAVGSTQSRVTAGLDGFQYALRIQRDSGNTGTGVIYVNQSFETSTMVKLANKTVTLSFYARAGANYSSASSLFNARVVAGTGTEANIIFTGVTGSTEPATATPTLTTSWQRFTVTGLIPSGTNGGGVYFFFTPTGTAGAADYVDITGIQLEANTVATPFEQRPIGVELALCQRYYSNMGYDTSNFVDGYQINTAYITQWIKLPQQMRVKPTSVSLTLGGVSNTTGHVAFAISPDYIQVYGNPVTTGRGYYYISGITASAEL